MKLLQVLTIISLAVLITGCASSNNNAKLSTTPQNNLNDADFDEFDLLEEEMAEQVVDIADPLEPFNRLMYGLNDILYFWVAKPCAQVCKAITPKPVRIGISNFFHNITTPARYVNCLLQGKGESADTELRRFLVNSTVGVLGFGDPAKDRYGLEPVEEDLGQTLAVHGMDQGFYIVWPLLGPSTFRDSLGMAGDMFMNPVRYVDHFETSIAISSVRVVNEGTFHIGEYEDFKAAALEPYIAMRQAYIQYRNKKVEE